MNITCGVSRDLLPLYAENLVSAETRLLLTEHLAACPACRAELEAMQAPDALPQDADAVPLKKIGASIRKRRTLSTALGIFIALTLALIIVQILSAPEFIPFDESLASVSQGADGRIVVRFRQSVQGYDLFSGMDVDVPGQRAYYLSAWKSIWNRLIQTSTPQTIVLNPDGETVNAVYYYDATGSNGAPLQLIYGTYGGAGERAGAVLPRLALAYYVLMALALAAVLAILYFLLPKRLRARRVIGILLPLPLSYLAANVFIKGFKPSTYVIIRDFIFIMLLTGLLYAAVLTLHGLVREKRPDRAL